MLMDECKRVSTEGQDIRLDLAARFHNAIKDSSDVTNKMEEQKNECLSQLKENEMLREKLKQFADQYALSEQHFEQKLKKKTLELELADLKIKQHEEKLVQEQVQMKVYAEQVSQLLATEKNLRMQLTADGEKFQQFQILGIECLYHLSWMADSLTPDFSEEDALLKSNEVFETFKEEIEKRELLKKQLEKTSKIIVPIPSSREEVKLPRRQQP
ncbi:beta-taxilin-like isoform X3 [Hibiscus syriacus]|uniref:Beta-taxilin-like isoform X3 n=1 Tax=Hibiscus syriacus TaxID=106335 RepID=A0A6A2X6E0_HIBSY|nr:beta-taxilin-like isoform X3 [Hibiscus syriacus]